MLATKVLLPLVLTLASPEPDPSRLIHGGLRAAWAWAAVTGGKLWVCWEPDARLGDPAQGCWNEVPVDFAEHGLPDLDDEAPSDLPVERNAGGTALASAQELHLAFLDGSTLIIGDEAEARFALHRGQTRPEPLDPLLAEAADIPLQAPRPMACSPTGWLPVHTAEGWRWHAASCDGREVCLVPSARQRRRRPTGARLGLGVEAGLAWIHTAPSPTALRTGASARLLMTAVLRFDPALLRRQRRSVDGLAAISRRVLRELPKTEPGPLAQAERSALRDLLCPSQGATW